MSDLNVVTIIGRLTKDCEVRTTPSGKGCANFTIASNKRVKKGEEWVDECSFFDCKFWLRTESMKNYLVKGKQVAIDGSLHQDKWESEGQTRSKIVIEVNNVELLGDSTKSSDAKPVEPKKEAYSMNDIPW